MDGFRNQRIEEKRRILNDVKANSISLEKVSFPQGFTDEEEAEIQVKVFLKRLCFTWSK